MAYDRHTDQKNRIEHPEINFAFGRGFLVMTPNTSNKK